MRKSRDGRTIFAVLLFAALLIVIPIQTVAAQETLIWEEELSSYLCPPVTSPVLEAGREYRIWIRGTFASYTMSGIIEYAADAMYYTIMNVPTGTNPDIWVWPDYQPAPDGHSFVQIDGNDVNWGPFNNGVVNPWGGHEYTINYVGTGASITFSIEEWMDPLRDCVLNFCHFDIKIYELPPPPSGETAFAYGGDYATCFLCFDFDGNGKSDFKNWGWSNGPLAAGSYEFELWAGAAKCDLTKGTLVGAVTVDYDGSTATVTYTIDAGWMMERTQLYVGSEPLPMTDGEYTVSPGQYPYIHDPVADPTTDTYTVTGLSGNIYVVAHADVIET
jgi:hypothetical protein